jgi:hypothetical protein
MFLKIKIAQPRSRHVVEIPSPRIFMCSAQPCERLEAQSGVFSGVHKFCGGGFNPLTFSGRQDVTPSGKHVAAPANLYP